MPAEVTLQQPSLALCLVLVQLRVHRKHFQQYFAVVQFFPRLRLRDTHSSR
jgi:hypothetical protein